MHQLSLSHTFQVIVHRCCLWEPVNLAVYVLYTAYIRLTVSCQHRYVPASIVHIDALAATHLKHGQQVIMQFDHSRNPHEKASATGCILDDTDKP